jgi:hypothetical protein
MTKATTPPSHPWTKIARHSWRTEHQGKSYIATRGRCGVGYMVYEDRGTAGLFEIKKTPIFNIRMVKMADILKSSADTSPAS